MIDWRESWRWILACLYAEVSTLSDMTSFKEFLPFSWAYIMCIRSSPPDVGIGAWAYCAEL